MAKITVRRTASLLVEGDDVTVVDWNGKEYRAGEAALLPVPLRRVHAQAVLRRLPFEQSGSRAPGGRAELVQIVRPDAPLRSGGLRQ